MKVTIKYSDGFRNYNNVVDAVKNNYMMSRKNQTLEFVKNIRSKYLNFDVKMNIDTVFKHLEKFVDVSDRYFSSKLSPWNSNSRRN